VEIAKKKDTDPDNSAFEVLIYVNLGDNRRADVREVKVPRLRAPARPADTLLPGNGKRY
jgi:hypothetical protein